MRGDFSVLFASIKLKRWKAEAGPAFSYSRVYDADLLDWINNKAGEAVTA